MTEITLGLQRARALAALETRQVPVEVGANYEVVQVGDGLVAACAFIRRCDCHCFLSEGREKLNWNLFKKCKLFFVSILLVFYLENSKNKTFFFKFYQII